MKSVQGFKSKSSFQTYVVCGEERTHGTIVLFIIKFRNKKGTDPSPHTGFNKKRQNKAANTLMTTS